MQEAIQVKIIPDPVATPEQQVALRVFADVALEFTELEVLAALKIAELPATSSADVLPHTSQPDKTQALYEAWRDVLKTDAVMDSLFDDTTEEEIANDKRFKALLAARAGPAANKHEIKNEIIRLRFAIFAGRQATTAAQPQIANFDTRPEALEDAS